MRLKVKDVVKEKVDENKYNTNARNKPFTDHSFTQFQTVRLKFSYGTGSRIEDLTRTHVFASFSYVIASRGFHHYRVTTWPDVYDGEMVSVIRETDPNSLPV